MASKHKSLKGAKYSIEYSVDCMLQESPQDSRHPFANTSRRGDCHREHRAPSRHADLLVERYPERNLGQPTEGVEARARHLDRAQLHLVQWYRFRVGSDIARAQR